MIRQQDAWDPVATAIASLRVGKRLPDAVYLHVSTIGGVAEPIRKAVTRARELASVAQEQFHVVKLGLQGDRLSLLSYPEFFEDAFPALGQSWAVDLKTGKVASKKYTGSNPPILHRKETLLAPDHPEVERFARLTADAEALGLFEQASEIGTRAAWESRLARLSLKVVGHELVELPKESEAATPANNDDTTPSVQRHKTALIRYALSTPMQALWRHGYLDGDNSVFDYGCGRGDDLSALRKQGLTAQGWDPHFAPDEPKAAADVVNLGFVLNVIEDPNERAGALRGAFSLARKVLAVAVLIGGRSVFERFRLFRDGVITQRGTFQKYYAQGELRDYLATTLRREPVALAPGLFLVFANDEEEQRFLERRQRSFGVLGAHPSVPRERLERAPREPRAPRPRAPTKWDLFSEVIEAFYLRCLELARVPEPDEFSRYPELRENVGQPGTVFNRLLRERGNDALELARHARRTDLLVYLALNVFERRRSFSSLPDATRRDIKSIWGNYANAQAEAQSLLFSVGKSDVVHKACNEAAAASLGHLDGEHDLQLHASLAAALPAVLRVYIGCAARIYGAVDSADLVKIHIQSGKLSLLNYDDFEGKAVPMLIERVKIDMRRQDIGFFEYGPERPQGLFLKARYMHPSMPGFESQRAFDEALIATKLFDFSSFGPPLPEFIAQLDEASLGVRGFELKNVRRRKG